MRTGKHCLTPLAAVASGILAGAVGTVCLDTVQYLRHRRAGGTEGPLAGHLAYGAGTGVTFWLIAEGLD